MCTTHHGLRVISGSMASDEALEQTAHLINSIMDYVDPMVAPKMTSNGFRHAVMAPYPTELTTDIPEHAWLGDSWNERARGLGATMSLPVGSSAEENILCHNNDRSDHILRWLDVDTNNSEVKLVKLPTDLLN